MGYESRLYVVNKTSYTDEVNGKEMRWGEKIATFNLCCIDDAGDKMRKYGETDAYIYEGDTRLTEDCYGDLLREIPVEDAIKILEEAEAKEHYRRFIPCIQLLKGFNLSEWENLVVLHYGY